MTRSYRLLIAPIVVVLLFYSFSACCFAAFSSSSGKWKITSIKVCRLRSGYLNPHVEALGQFPLYSFFVPRPVWTVNGTVVEAQPIYDRGKLISFRLLSAAGLLKSKAKNTVKFSLPDQNASKTFYYDKAKPPADECYEFF
jgi:hypothetical protein